MDHKYPTKKPELVGVGIHISAAARKYDIPQPTISRWFEKGYIHYIGMDKNRVLVDEADVAFLAELYKLNPGQGTKTIKTYFKTG